MKKRYQVLIGLTYGGRDVPAGETVDDVPKRSVAWLLEMGAIREQSAGGQVADDQAPPAADEQAPADEPAPEEEGRS